jgi:hypothetical protein
MQYYSGLSEDEETAASGEPAYEFAGFEIVSSVKVALIQPTAAPGR